MKNIIKAAVYVVLGTIGTIGSIIGIVSMYFSNTFLPVYIKDTYVIGNQIVRYELYLILFVAIILSVKLAEYGIKFLIKKFPKN